MCFDITFENYGSFNVTLSSTEGSTVTFSDNNNLRDCTDFIKYHLEHDKRIISGCITDSETGEIVATIERS